MSGHILQQLKIVEELKTNIADQQSLLGTLQANTSKYNIFDLVNVQSFIAREIKFLPSPYKEELKAKWNEQLFSTFKEIRKAEIKNNNPLNMETYHDFLQHFENALKTATDKTETTSKTLYNLCAAYNFFITNTPAHPIGTPFPGGFKVEKKGNNYYCPVKDKQKDTPESICKFCIAKQTNLEKEQTTRDKQ